MPDAVDALLDLASVYDFFDVGDAEIERIIGEEFSSKSGDSEADSEADREMLRRMEEYDRKRERERGDAGLPGNGKTARSGSQGEIELLAAGGITMESIAWLWSNHLARGKLTMVSGPSELGEKHPAVDLAARLSCGSDWPDGDDAPCGNVSFSPPRTNRVTVTRRNFVAAEADLSPRLPLALRETLRRRHPHLQPASRSGKARGKIARLAASICSSLIRSPPTWEARSTAIRLSMCARYSSRCKKLPKLFALPGC